MDSAGTRSRKPGRPTPAPIRPISPRHRRPVRLRGRTPIRASTRSRRPPYASYGSSRPYDLPPTGAYGTNPYEAPPYQPTPGGYSPYGVAPAQHPRAVPAMVLGIVGIVLAASCGVGGFVGIAGIVLGRQARTEIDAEPGRYAGRSQAVAGIVTGAIGTALAVLITILLVVVFAVGAGLEDF